MLQICSNIIINFVISYYHTAGIWPHSYDSIMQYIKQWHYWHSQVQLVGWIQCSYIAATSFNKIFDCIIRVHQPFSISVTGHAKHLGENSIK